MKQLNINSTVKCKLTDYGKKIHYQNHLDFWECDDKGWFPYSPPVVDGDGYSSFQLWDLMEKFGSYCGLGKEPPFDTVMLIEEKDLK